MADNETTTGPDEATDEDSYDVPTVATALSGRRGGSRSSGRIQALSQEISDDDLLGGGNPARAPRPRAAEPVEEEEVADEASGDKPVTINVSPGVDKRLKAYRNKTGMTNLEIVWEAVEAASEEGFEKVLAAAVPPAKPRRFGVRASQVRFAGVGSNSVYTRMTPDERNELRRLVRVSGVPDRSKLIAISLNWHLPGAADKPV